MIKHEHGFKVGDIVNANDWPYDTHHVIGRIERIIGIYVWLEGNDKAWHMSGVEKAEGVIIPERQKRAMDTLAYYVDTDGAPRVLPATIDIVPENWQEISAFEYFHLIDGGTLPIIEIVSANRDPEDAYNTTLEALRDIDSKIPSSARLPGSPALTDQMAHLLKKYTEFEDENKRLKIALEPFVVIFSVWLDRDERALEIDFIDWVCNHLKARAKFNPRRWFDNAFSTYKNTRG